MNIDVILSGVALWVLSFKEKWTCICLFCHHPPTPTPRFREKTHSWSVYISPPPLSRNPTYECMKFHLHHPPQFPLPRLPKLNKSGNGCFRRSCCAWTWRVSGMLARHRWRRRCSCCRCCIKLADGMRNCSGWGEEVKEGKQTTCLAIFYLLPLLSCHRGGLDYCDRCRKPCHPKV